MYFSTGYELFEILSNLFEQLPSSKTTEEHKSNLASFENAGIEQLPSVETTEDFELPRVEKSEVSNLWATSIHLYSKPLLSNTC
jgi:hypothetical protein